MPESVLTQTVPAAFAGGACGLAAGLAAGAPLPEVFAGAAGAGFEAFFCFEAAAFESGVWELEASAFFVPFLAVLESLWL